MFAKGEKTFIFKAMLKNRPVRSGFTMIELLISVAIIATLAVVFLLFARTQLNRAHDADRKADLDRIKIAFEDYYNDNGCYPPATILDNCNGPELRPYLDRVPCDPNGDPYLYLPVEGAECSGYRLFTALYDQEDPTITKLGCDGPEACGVGTGYNYGVSAGVGIGNGQGGAAASGSSRYACSPGGGGCNFYNNPAAAGCPVSFSDASCQDRCDNSAFWCDL